MKAVILAGLLSVTAVGIATAAPFPTTVPDNSNIIQVAGGCGLGWHRGPYGGCRRNWGPPVRCYWVRGPYGRMHRVCN